jgi:hypothetical protein
MTEVVAGEVRGESPTKELCSQVRDKAGGGGWGVVLQTFCLWQLWNPAPHPRSRAVLVEHEILFVKIVGIRYIRLYLSSVNSLK